MGADRNSTHRLRVDPWELVRLIQGRPTHSPQPDRRLTIFRARRIGILSSKIRVPPSRFGRERSRRWARISRSPNSMKETARTTTGKPSENSHRSRAVPPAKQKKSSPTAVHRDRQKRTNAKEPEKRTPGRSAHAAGAEKRGHKRRIHAAEAENRHSQPPIHVEGVRNPGPQPSVHFAGVENRSYAAHLNDIRAEPHPKPAANPLPGLFHGHRKQP